MKDDNGKHPVGRPRKTATHLDPATLRFADGVRWCIARGLDFSGRVDFDIDVALTEARRVTAGYPLAIVQECWGEDIDWRVMARRIEERRLTIEAPPQLTERQAQVMLLSLCRVEPPVEVRR